MSLLTADDIEPGTAPSYELCKTILSYHPLGLKMAAGPVKMAMSKPRVITVSAGPEELLQKAFNDEWKRIGADKAILNLMTLARAYGIASIVNGVPDAETRAPLTDEQKLSPDLYFNVLDPLNTAGSMVLNQNPNSPDFQKPTHVESSGKAYHPSRGVTILNEQPIYIEFTNSAFGFVGRSVYQRALYPLKTYIQTMITDDAIAEKAMLLVMKIKAPGSVIDQQSRSWFGFKRKSLQGAKTGNVISIGIDEAIESLDLKNVRDAAEFARNNCMKNIATSADIPAILINQETLAEGFGEGSEDAKMVAEAIDRIRADMDPAYEYFDSIVMARAWSEEFYKTMQAQFPDLFKGVPYKTAFYEWKNSFVATWPNLLTEPDSEKVKVDGEVLKSGIALYEVLVPNLDPENRATASLWLADLMNARKMLVSAPLELDEDALMNYEPPIQPQGSDEHKPIPESGEE
nr:anti-CBASS Acb1 family protein [Robbsia andropogonis]